MGYYVNKDGEYYEGDKQEGSVEVPRRPGRFFDWDGEKWVDNSRANYRELRAPEYPPAADYLDALVKGDQAGIDAYVAKCLAVKAKYPKP